MHQIQIKKLPLRRMHKRDIRGISPRCLVPKNVEMLRTVRQQFEKLNHVVKYMYDVTKSNQKFFESVDMKVEYRDRIPSKHSPLVQAREFAEKIESFEDRDIYLSILSPKLLNLMPETLADPESKRWLSPNMLSFQDEGMLPLPRLFQMSTSDHCETMRWIDLLMDLSGAKRMFNETSGIFGKFMNEVEEIMHPRIKQLEVHDGKFEHIQRLSSGDQQPLTLTVRVLAPSAFRLMLFSPVTLVAWIMVPEAFLAKIFAPKLLNVRVMSPETFSFILLSPIAGNVRALSPNTMNLLVLSPSFGTYQLFSGNRHVIQVLSPGILGVDSQPFLREPFRA
ncbi:hypothetical protein M3Y97_00632700 [Aphelenchoides bicaudatus]|nr:hypothetical protein M3Y97_00632700 [Aphelenchoides bicaudatus]